MRVLVRVPPPRLATGVLHSIDQHSLRGKRPHRTLLGAHSGHVTCVVRHAVVCLQPAHGVVLVRGVARRQLEHVGASVSCRNVLEMARCRLGKTLFMPKNAKWRPAHRHNAKTQNLMISSQPTTLAVLASHLPLHPWSLRRDAAVEAS